MECGNYNSCLLRRSPYSIAGMKANKRSHRLLHNDVLSRKLQAYPGAYAPGPPRPPPGAPWGNDLGKGGWAGLAREASPTGAGLTKWTSRYALVALASGAVLQIRAEYGCSVPDIHPIQGESTMAEGPLQG